MAPMLAMPQPPRQKRRRQAQQSWAEENNGAPRDSVNGPMRTSQREPDQKDNRQFRKVRVPHHVRRDEKSPSGVAAHHVQKHERMGQKREAGKCYCRTK